MKRQARTLALAVLAGGMVWWAGAQLNLNSSHINLDAPTIHMRSYDAPNGYTTVFGNLEVTSGILPGKGVLSCKGAYLNGYTSVINNLWVSGNISATNLKSFIHPHPVDTTKVIRYVAMESDEVLTVARGTAKTANGQATIALPEYFSMVTSQNAPLTVILTPEGAPVLLYTKQKSTKEVVIAMKASDFEEFKDVEFAYQITGVRDGFENLGVIIDEDKLDAPNNVREDVQKRIDAHIERVKARDELKMGVRDEERGLQEEYTETGNTTSGETMAPVQVPDHTAQVNNTTNKKTAAPVATAPAETLAAEFTAGPNPADRRQGGVVNFYHQGGPIKDGRITIYDAAGHAVNKIKIHDEAKKGDTAKRQVGSWKLTDKKGKTVPEGTYLVKGTITGADGKKNAVSISVGVR